MKSISNKHINGSEFYITVYGSIAQSESENISANVKWGKEQSAREGNVSFHYKNFLGYRKGDDGKPEIVPEEAETIQYIYERFLAGDSHQTIISKLESNNLNYSRHCLIIASTPEKH